MYSVKARSETLCYTDRLRIALAAAWQNTRETGDTTTIRVGGRVLYGVDEDGEVWRIDDSGVPAHWARSVEEYLNQH